MYVDRVRIDYVQVPMRDGVELCAKLTRPDADGPFPAIMEYNPYRRLRRPLPDYRDEYPPAVPYLAEHGYAVVQFDVRGTGNSAGFTTDIYSDVERQDAYDIVAWIAAQPWCTGAVGMLGKSYSAVVQWHVAVQNPPALKAIIVRSANDDIYTEWVYPGGCLRPYMMDTYSPLMNAYNFAPPDPDVIGDVWRERWQQRLEGSGPWGLGYVAHPLHGPHWQDRSLSADYSRVKCAVMVVGGWSDVYPTALLRAYEKLDCPKKALVGPWGHWYGEEHFAVPGPRIDTRPVYLRWFDHWLRGIDNGVMDEPPVTLFVREFSEPSPRMPLVEPGTWRHESEWPLARTDYQDWYLHGEGRLAHHLPDAEGADTYRYHAGAGITSGLHWGGGVLPWGMPLDQRGDEPFSLVYTSDALEQDLEVTGVPRAVLYVSSTAEVAYFRVKLVDVAPNGTAKLVRYGGLNATHRHSHFTPEPLVPGEVYELEVPIKAVSYVFPRGHRIRVMISSADFQNAWPTAQPADNTVHRGGAYASRIVLPVAPPQSPPLPEPELIYLPPADAASLHKPTEYSIQRDLANSSTTVRLHVDSDERGDGLTVRSALTVHDDDPAQAELKAEARYVVRRDQFEVEVHADELTTSDAEAFQHRTQVSITLNGQPHFNKEWSTSVPRQLN